jgi:hypothetical protein
MTSIALLKDFLLDIVHMKWAGHVATMGRRGMRIDYW